MSNFKALSERSVREQINATQVWDAWIEAEDLRRHSFVGTMGWERRANKQYLYRRKGRVGKSLGPRSADTEAMLEAFREGRERNEARLKSLAGELDTQAAILRSLGVGRVPRTAARVLREIRIHGKAAPLRVVGTNALYAYEALAGVIFEEGTTATGDIDLLQDDRKRLRLVTDEREAIGLARLIQERVDKSFEPRGSRDFRLTNDKGYMIELIRPEPRPAYRKMPGDDPSEADDVAGAPIAGLQWLVNAPAINVVAVDEGGYPVPMTSPDPRFWAAHKFWISTRADRDPVKSTRDRQQARSVVKLLTDRLPHLALDQAFIAMLPNELAPMMTQESAAISKGKVGTSPTW